MDAFIPMSMTVCSKYLKLIQVFFLQNVFLVLLGAFSKCVRGSYINRSRSTLTSCRPAKLFHRLQAWTTFQPVESIEYSQSLHATQCWRPVQKFLLCPHSFLIQGAKFCTLCHHIFLPFMVSPSIYYSTFPLRLPHNLFPLSVLPKNELLVVLAALPLGMSITPSPSPRSSWTSNFS